MDGFFATPRELFGVEHQLTMYYDDPELMHDINNHMLNLWLSMLEELLSTIDLDFCYVWEDMSFKNGPLLSPRMFKEFIVPYYKRLDRISACAWYRHHHGRYGWHVYATDSWLR